MAGFHLAGRGEPAARQTVTGLGAGVLQNQVLDPNTHYSTAVLDFTGTPHFGETWTVTVDGTEFSHVAGDPVSGFANNQWLQLDAVVEGLKLAIAGFSVDRTGNTLTITPTASESVTVAFATAPRTATSTALVTPASNGLSATYEPQGAIVPGDTWSLKINSTTYMADVPNVQPNVAALKLVEALRDKINRTKPAAATYSASVDAQDRLVVTDTVAVTVVHVGVTFPPPDGAAMFNNGTVAPGTYHVSGDLKLEADTPVSPGDLWQVTIDGNTYRYAAQANDDSLTAIAAGLTDPTNPDRIPDAYSPSVNGGVIEIADAQGFVFQSIQRTRDPGSLVNIENDSAHHYNQARFALSDGNVQPSETWTLHFDGNSVQYETNPGDGLGHIADALVTLVKNFQDAPQHDPYDANRVGTTNTIEITAAGKPITVSLDRVRPLHAVFDIDGGNVVRNDGGIFGFLLAYTDTPFVELTGPGINTPLRSTGSSSIDAGSTNLSDPFLEYIFTTAGTFELKVGTHRDYDRGGEGYRGVVSDQRYRLNVSIPTHPTDTSSVIDLVDKTVTITDGTGAGQSNVISGYDPDNKIYTFRNTWTPSTDSVFDSQLQHRG